MGVSLTAAGRVRGGKRDDDARLQLARRVEFRVSKAMVLANTIGALDLFALLFFVLPAPPGVDRADNLTANLVAFAIYLPLACIIGHHFGVRTSAARSAWILEGRNPNADERAQAVAAPLKCAITSAALWLSAAVLFAAINVGTSWDLALHVATTVVMGGITTCAVGYLLVERIQRPITALVLATGAAPAPRWPGVEGRLVLAWLSATGVPLIGVVMVACDGLRSGASAEEIARATLILSVAAFILGLATMLIAARSMSAPLTAVRRALGRVQAGDLGAEVEVDDASEVGLLQSGFNSMVGGLRERERVQDLFSRHVGADVAAAALEDDPRLGGGEVKGVAVLFVDMIGSTALAHNAPPERVVARLNRFFALVVDIVGRHGGWVNKFEGDAALCVFGAPVEQGDPAACALAAARELQRRMKVELPGVEAGIGLSAGPAVAGWVGAEQRFEYTVIGDPVNEAARLCDLAKRADGHLLASAAIVGRAGGAEAALWRLGEEHVLRGRAAPTRLAIPTEG